jgi:hypothetical protein
MMTFEQFQNELLLRCRSFAHNGRKIEVLVSDVKKLSGCYPALTLIRDDQSTGICFNLNDLYAMYEGEKDLDGILAYLKAHMDDDIPHGDIDTVLEYEKIRDALFIRVSNAYANRGLLMEVPHRIYEEFAITYHIRMICDEQMLGSTMINKEMLARYGIDEQQLYEDAMQNAPKLFRPDILKFSSGHIGNMYVVTNTDQINGAAVMFYPGFMEKLYEEVHEDMYVVPSSMHEMIIFPVSAGENAEQLKQVLHHANRDCVMPGETLSENIYFISGKDKRLRRIFS